MEQSWTTQQGRDYRRARHWARDQLLPYAAADTFATWYAHQGVHLFLLDDLQAAFARWSSEQPHQPEED